MISLSVENWPWKRLWTCLKTNCVMNNSRCREVIFGIDFYGFSTNIYGRETQALSF
jgi:hypothetical protein